MKRRFVSLRVVVPLALGLVLSLAVLLFAELGHRRLEAANRVMSRSMQTQTTLTELLVLAGDAETGQRGYLLTEREEYLAPYQAALAHMEERLTRLRDLVHDASPAQRERVGRINNLLGKKLGELDASLALYRQSGRAAALELVNTDIGIRTMDDVRAAINQALSDERDALAAGVRQWEDDLAEARFGLRLMTASTVVLLLLVWLLASREFALRERSREALAESQAHLEALVEDRTAELSELSTHLQIASEQEKAKYARDIHDELGSILVSAKMDVSWVRARLESIDPEAAGRLDRVDRVLDEGVDIKRRIIEELRPTLLDNLGLGAATEWQVSQVCERAGIAWSVAVDDDQDLPGELAITVFRIIQEALTNVVRYAEAKHVSVEVSRTDDTLTLVIQDDGIGIAPGAQHNRLSHGISGMRQRVRALHGEFSICGQPGAGTTIEVSLPLGRGADAATGVSAA